MKIGVFDSGVGGQSVANAIKREIPDLEILVMEDKANLPYGTKTPDQLFRLVLPLLKSMQYEGCKVIVVACNSVTTNIIEELRQNLPVPLIGMEPMVKPAAEQTKSGVIAVCATPVTLQSKRYNWLKQTYAQNVQVLEPDCSDWASLIENNEIDRKHVQQQINSVCENGADVIVLGCTHYHWIEEIIKQVANGRAAVLQPETPVIAQLKKVLERLS
jgi:glutamate racemase